jgi:hypothetical protein
MFSFLFLLLFWVFFPAVLGFKLTVARQALCCLNQRLNVFYWWQRLKIFQSQKAKWIRFFVNIIKVNFSKLALYEEKDLMTHLLFASN